MGDLKGHLFPGSLFLMYGLWWAVGTIKRYFTCRRSGVSFTSSITFPCPLTCGRLTSWPVESVLKITLPAFGMFAEIIFNLPVPGMGIVQHATMYFFFMISGVVDLLMYLGVPLPAGTDYVSLALAFLVEGLLFANHLHGRPVVDTEIHILLVYVVFVTVGVVLLEARFKQSPVLTLSRAYLVMLQGSWFCGVGIILYGHDRTTTPWKLDNHMDAMQATIYFSWHCAAHFIVLLVLTALVSVCYRVPSGAPYQNGNSLVLSTLHKGGDSESYTALVSHEDEDSDIEFEKPRGKPLLSSQLTSS